MKKTMFVLYPIMLASAVSTAVHKVDELHVNAYLAIGHFDTSTNVGGIYGSAEDLKLDCAKCQDSIDIISPLSKLQAGSEHFTQHLKSADIFSADKYPEIRFVFIRFNSNGRKLSSVGGNLTMGGKTAPVELETDKFNRYQSPVLKAEVCGGDFGTTINRTKWSLDYLISVGMNKKVNISIQIEVAKQ